MEPTPPANPGESIKAFLERTKRCKVKSVSPRSAFVQQWGLAEPASYERSWNEKRHGTFPTVWPYKVEKGKRSVSLSEGHALFRVNLTAKGQRLKDEFARFVDKAHLKKSSNSAVLVHPALPDFSPTERAMQWLTYPVSLQPLTHSFKSERKTPMRFPTMQ